jgi:phosphotransferase system HPr-like phosphotransfer protein
MSGKKSEGPAVEQELWVENRLGLHARPVAKIANTASNSMPTSPWRKTASRSTPGIYWTSWPWTAPREPGLVLRARGPQAREAATSITSLFARKFEET